MPALHANDLCAYIDASPSPYHAVKNSVDKLKEAGFIELDEKLDWKLKPGSAYYIIRDGAALAAFRLGKKAPKDTGYAIAAAHTDSPVLRIRAEKSVKSRGLHRVAVESYGSPIISSWLDRPLSVAGRLVTKDGNSIKIKLYHSSKAMAIIPNLAIHFNKDMNKGVEYPLNSAMLAVAGIEPEEAGDIKEDDKTPWLLRLVCEEAGIKVEDLLSCELSFLDAQASMLIGKDKEIISAPRIDNLEACHSVISSLVMSTAENHTQVAVLFDNEEIGSTSYRGANSSFLQSILERISIALKEDAEAHKKAMAKSFCVSVDVAQAWHPSYADRFEDDAPLLNAGPAIKLNANLRYASDAPGEAAFILLCKDRAIPFQDRKSVV